MNIEQRDRFLAIDFDRKALDLSRELPGMRKWRDGKLLIEPSSDNIAALVAQFPSLEEREDLPVIRRVMKAIRDAEAIRQAKRAKGLPRGAWAFNYKTQPYEHQKQAFGHSRHKEFFGLLMEMGTGKTKVLIDTAFDLHNQGLIDTVLVIAPNGVHRQWVEEQLPVHASAEYEAMAYQSGMGVKLAKSWRRLCEQQRPGLTFLTMAYESLVSKPAKDAVQNLLGTKKVLWILDESHKIKNPSAARTKFILKWAYFAAYRRIATGTPLTQSVEDYYTQLKFLSPDILAQSSYWAFRNRYCLLQPIPGAPPGAMRVSGYRDLLDLRDRIEGSTYEVTKAQCLDLPPKIYRTREVELTSEQQRLYRQLKDLLLAEIEDGTIVTATLAITRMMKLQQVVNGHLTDEEGKTHRMEQRRTAAVLEQLEESPRAIVWARFREDLFLLRDSLEANGHDCGLLYGDTPSDERRRLVEPGAVDVLIANPQVAGVGLNLAHWSHAIYYSNSFNAADRWQSEDRTHRIGQGEACVYTDLIAKGTIDRHILRALRDKKNLADSLSSVREALESV